MWNPLDQVLQDKLRRWKVKTEEIIRQAWQIILGTAEVYAEQDCAIRAAGR